MPRTAVSLVVSIGTLVAAFLVTTAIASPQSPDIRSDLPVAQLQPVSVPRDQRLAINDLLAHEFGARIGITAESYDRAREITRTSVGPLYLIPGTSGACLYLAAAVSCGDPGSPDGPLLALLTLDPSGKRLVGGGVTANSVEQVTIKHPVAGRLSVAVASGAFVITEAHNLSPARGLVFTAE